MKARLALERVEAAWIMFIQIAQGRVKEDKPTYTFFLYVQKAYDTVWWDGLWLKLWDTGVKGKCGV